LGEKIHHDPRKRDPSRKGGEADSHRERKKEFHTEKSEEVTAYKSTEDRKKALITNIKREYCRAERKKTPRNGIPISPQMRFFLHKRREARRPGKLMQEEGRSSPGAGLERE